MTIFCASGQIDFVCIDAPHVTEARPDLYVNLAKMGAYGGPDEVYYEYGLETRDAGKVTRLPLCQFSAGPLGASCCGLRPTISHRRYTSPLLRSSQSSSGLNSMRSVSMLDEYAQSAGMCAWACRYRGGVAQPSALSQCDAGWPVLRDGLTPCFIAGGICDGSLIAALVAARNKWLRLYINFCGVLLPPILSSHFERALSSHTRCVLAALKEHRRVCFRMSFSRRGCPRWCQCHRYTFSAARTQRSEKRVRRVWFIKSQVVVSIYAFHRICVPLVDLTEISTICAESVLLLWHDQGHAVPFLTQQLANKFTRWVDSEMHANGLGAPLQPFTGEMRERASRVSDAVLRESDDEVVEGVDSMSYFVARQTDLSMANVITIHAFAVGIIFVMFDHTQKVSEACRAVSIFSYGHLPPTVCHAASYSRLPPQYARPLPYPQRSHSAPIPQAGVSFLGVFTASDAPALKELKTVTANIALLAANSTFTIFAILAGASDRLHRVT